MGKIESSRVGSGSDHDAVGLAQSCYVASPLTKTQKQSKPLSSYLAVVENTPVSKVEVTVAASPRRGKPNRSSMEASSE